MVDSRTKVLHELRDQGSQESATTAFNEPRSRDQGSQDSAPTAFSESESRDQGSQVTFTAEFDELCLQDIPESEYEQQFRESSTSALNRQTIEAIQRMLDEDDYQEDSEQLPNVDDEYQEAEFTYLPRQRVRKYKNRSKSDTNLPDDDSKIDDDKSS